MKLTDCTEPCLFKGTVLRFAGEYPFDKGYTDFMICEYPSAGEGRCDLALYCVSGYHAGSIEYVFPKEARAENARAVSTEWLRDNWQSRVYGGCTANEVSIIK